MDSRLRIKLSFSGEGPLEGEIVLPEANLGPVAFIEYIEACLGSDEKFVMELVTETEVIKIPKPVLNQAIISIPR